MSHKNIDEIISKVKEILAISAETDQDKALQQFVRFIFTDEFKKDTITEPVKNREKDSYKFLEQYIKLVHSLFKLKKDERNKLYNDASLYKGYNEISQHKEQLDKLVAKKDDDLSKIKEDKMNQLNVIKSYLYNLISHQPKTLFSKLDEFHFYFILYIPSSSTLQFLLYSILKNKFRDVFIKFDYQDFCPNFDDETCLNLIILFFDNIKNKKRELLFIFALLILQYEVIFKYRINKKYPKFILQHAAEKTLQIVESKTLQNGLILEYTYIEYLSNLDKIIYLYDERQRKMKNFSINENQIIILKNNDNPQSQKNPKENSTSTIPEGRKNSGDDKFEEEKKNELKREENKINNSEVNKINKPFSEAVDNQIYQEVKEVTKEEINEEGKVKKNIDEKDKILEGNNISEKKEPNSEIKGENLPEINNSNVIASKKEENNITNQPKVEITNLSNQELYSLFQQQLTEQKKKNEIRFSELEKNFEIRYSQLKKKIEINSEQLKENKGRFSELKKISLKLKEKERENEKKFSELKSEIQSLKGMISTIQIRKLAKNFLNIFKSDLSEEEKEIIKKDESKKGEETLKSLKRKYPLYIDTENFKTVYEIVEKSGEALNKGNELEKDIFLKKMGISDDTFDKCFKFIQNNVEKK